MTRLLLALFAIPFLTCACFAVDDPAVPDGVVYKKTTTQINERAAQMLQKTFLLEATDEQVHSLFGDKVLICGPGLWRRIKDDPSFQKLDKGKVTLQVPVLDEKGNAKRMDSLEGKLFMSPEEILIFWKVFAKKTDFADLKPRKLTPMELKIFWAMISFDITEPIFILENKNHKILTAFASPDKLNVVWIDDYQEVSLKNDKPGRQ